MGERKFPVIGCDPPQYFWPPWRIWPSGRPMPVVVLLTLGILIRCHHRDLIRSFLRIDLIKWVRMSIRRRDHTFVHLSVNIYGISIGSRAKLCLSLSVHLSVNIYGISIASRAKLCRSLSVRPFVHLSVFLSVCLCLSVHLSVSSTAPWLLIRS